MPFLTEEVSSLYGSRDPGTLLCNAPFPHAVASLSNAPLLSDFELTTRIVAEVRSIRQKGHIPNKQALDLQVIVDAEGKHYPATSSLSCATCAMCHSVERIPRKVTGAFGFVLETHEFFIPAGDAVDLDAEKEKIQKDLDYQEGFLNIVRKKLGNERFVKRRTGASGRL